MNCLPFELLEIILKYLTTRDILQLCLVNKTWQSAARERKAHTNVGDIMPIVEQLHRLSWLQIELSEQIFTHVPCYARAKLNLINALHRVSKQFNGHPGLKHLSLDSDSALPGALKCPNLESLSVSTILAFDTSPNLDQEISSFEMGTIPLSLLHHARNIALILVKLPMLQKLHIVKPIFWRLPESPSYNISSNGVPRQLQPCQKPMGLLAQPSMSSSISMLHDLSIDSICAWSLVNLVNFIGQGHLLHLRKFALVVDLHLPYNTMKALSSGCPRLELLELSHVRLAPSHLLDLAGLKGSLTKLKFNFIQCYIPELEPDSSVYAYLLPYLANTLPNLTDLELAHTDIEYLPYSSNNMAVSLHRVNNKITHLTVLDLYDETECLLDFVPQTFPNLRKLKLHIGCRPRTINHKSLLTQMVHLRSLELRYRGCFLTEMDTESFHTQQSVTPRLPSLETLHLWAPPPCISIIQSTLVPMANTLTTLILKYPGPNFTDLLVSTTHLEFPVLRWLEIRVLSSKKSSSIDGIVQALARKPLPCLHFIHLETVSHLYTNLNILTIPLVSQAAPNLRHFAMEGIAVTQDILEQIMCGWSKSLRALELCGHAIDKMTNELFQSLSGLIENCTKVSRLTVSVEQVCDSVLQMILSDPRFSLVQSKKISINPYADDSAMDLSVDHISEHDIEEDHMGLYETDHLSPLPTQSLQTLLGELLNMKSHDDSSGNVMFKREIIDRNIALKIWLMNKYRKLDDVMVATQCPCRGYAD